MKLTGTWERDSKNPVLGSFILVFVCGGLYFFIASLILQVYIYVDVLSGGGSALSGDMSYVEYVKVYIERYKLITLGFTAVFQYIGFLLVPLLIIKKWHTPDISAYYHYDHIHIPGILLSVAGIFCIMPMVEVISQFFFNLFPVFEKISELSLPLFVAKNPIEMGFIIFVISITPAVCEEAIFRGYFQRTLQRKLPFPWHFIISGFVFALFHRQTLSLLALFLVGMYLSYIYYCFSSLYVSMAAHGVYNFIIIYLLNTGATPSLLFTENGKYHPPVVFISLVLFFLLIFIIYKFRVKEDHEPKNEEIEPAPL